MTRGYDPTFEDNNQLFPQKTTDDLDLGAHLKSEDLQDTRRHTTMLAGTLRDFY